ncbi:hypothetical protein A3G69_04385 [Candidatus Peribacteria bacterium RIFCSPLOWO2_12_FULL_53_10]|nr:MAG: hypothetical protein A3B61_03655 [Candidatus Peribacteria bacterium RIFCSPLOWO2_01_FULL_53_10]OGJ71441.1 MAG: hypothetical protein A3G69_04385 [Candidatus Peribacteria bacterium RIFCSPLOWO2_12_FULL_53_10]
MLLRLLTIGSALASVLFTFGAFTATAEASYYYDESYYNRSTPCYQYDAYGHCASSGTRYRARTTNNRIYNGPTYSNQYPYGYTNYGTNGTYRPVDNYYGNSRNNGCYWYYGSYRCDSSCNH